MFILAAKDIANRKSVGDKGDGPRPVPMVIRQNGEQVLVEGVSTNKTH